MSLTKSMEEKVENQTEIKKADNIKKHEQLKEEKDKSKGEFGHESSEVYLDKDKEKGQNLEEKENKEKVIWHEEGK